MENKLFELARRRRSIRRYTDEKVSDEIINEILKVALVAPSSWGKKPVEFIVVRNKKKIQEIAHCKRIGAGPLPNADVAIVVMVDTSNCELWIEDAAVASTHIILAAEEFNIGACWIHMRNRAGQHTTADEEIRKLLGVPNNYSVLNVIALGQKGETKRAYEEKDLHFENIHHEKF